MGNTVHMCQRRPNNETQRMVIEMPASMDPVQMYDFYHPWDRVSVQGVVSMDPLIEDDQVTYKEDFEEENNTPVYDSEEEEYGLPTESKWSDGEIDYFSEEDEN